MDYRLGTCSACGAQFKVAATFQGDKAKCKQCTNGVVEIGPVQSDSPAAGDDDALEEYVPSKKKKSGPSMMEKLRAERAAAEAPPKVPARKPAPKAAASRSSSRRAKAADDDGAPDESKAKRRAGARTSRATAAAGGRRGGSSRRKRGGDDDDGDDGEERGSRRHRPAPKKKNPAPIIGGFVLIVAATYGIWEFVLKEDEGAQAAEKPDEEVATNPEETQDPIDEGTEGTEDVTPEVFEPEPEPDPEPEPVKEKTDADYDPASVDLSVLTPFEKTEDTTDEEWTEIKQLVVTYIDPFAGAAGSRARGSLEEYGQKTFPAAVNAMLKLDVTQEQDRQNGDLLQKLLQFVANGRNVGWKYTNSNEDAVFNKKAIKKLWDVWNRAKDDEAYWRMYAKIDKADEPVKEVASDDDLDELDDLDDM